MWHGRGNICLWSESGSTPLGYEEDIYVGKTYMGRYVWEDIHVGFDRRYTFWVREGFFLRLWTKCTCSVGDEIYVLHGMFVCWLLNVPAT